MSNTYKLNAKLWREEYSKFKQNQASIIRSLIANARLGKIFHFDGYGEITFDNNDNINKWHPIVNMLSEFNRNKCNAMVWDIEPKEIQWAIPYNKIILYHDFYNSSKNGFYGIYWINTEDGTCVHHYCIDYLYDSITKDMQYTINAFKYAKAINECISKYKYLQGLNEKSST